MNKVKYTGKQEKSEKKKRGRLIKVNPEEYKKKSTI
jgi:hypothetical protein